MYYYEGSILPIEWTDQHGCGDNSKVSCEIVLQYACEDTLDPLEDDFLPWVQNKAQAGTPYRGKQHFRFEDHIASPRDGIPVNSDDAATDTIPDSEAAAIPDNRNDRRYGMHESYDFYQLCQRTERNKGLYAADQIIKRNDQRGTRQNPAGNRRGLECPEERDYYPWWHPNPWIDIAILTDSADNAVCSYGNRTACGTRCEYYMNNTMNYNKMGYCDMDHDDQTSNVNTKLNSQAWQQRRWYNNRGACEEAGFVWYEVSHSDVLDLGDNSFTCAKTQWSRTNQLGNAASNTPVISQQNASQAAGQVLKLKASEGLNANRFLWEIPRLPTALNPDTHVDIESAYKSCTLRIRYNISSADFPAWPQEANNPDFAQMVDSRNNSQSKYDPNTPLKQDPYVYIGPGDSDSFDEAFLSLAVNTNQYARTFQDRSYSFSIKKLPTESSEQDIKTDAPRVNIDEIKAALENGGKIYNVNVRGKRGNIVQTFPSVEYDFVPNALALGLNDMIHFQWTGSDYNPRRGCNNGEGGPPDLNTYYTSANANLNSRADRSNVVFTKYMGNNVPRNYMGYSVSEINVEDYGTKVALSTAEISSFAPCTYDDAPDNINEECYEIVRRLAYLNQQRDMGSLLLRQTKSCLTQEELESIQNQNERENHPLNCAKLNAKPFPYFDGGIMLLRRTGWFPFFSSRNNNFSNRQQIGVLCVGDAAQCAVDPNSGVLQDVNPLKVTSSVEEIQNSISDSTSVGDCEETVGPNSNAVVSCSSSGTVNIIDGETVAIQEGDNDHTGDGQSMGCDVVYYSNTTSVEDHVGLAVGLLFLGLFSAWLSYFLYNRYHAKEDGASRFRGEEGWQNQTFEAGGVAGSRPLSNLFSRSKYQKPLEDDTRPPESTEIPRHKGAFTNSPKARPVSNYIDKSSFRDEGDDEEEEIPLSAPRGGDRISIERAKESSHGKMGADTRERAIQFAQVKTNVPKKKGPKASEMI